MNWSWLWAGGGIVAAVGVFLLARRFLGLKGSAIAAGIVFAIGAAKAALSSAERRGRLAQRAEQDRANQAAIDRANAAREAERQRQRETNGAIDENDPRLRD